MPSTKIFGWLVFTLSLGAYVPLSIGGWQHPAETNIACFSLWTVLAGTLTYSSWVQKYEGWRINLAFLIGNIIVTGLALIRGGYTFNIGPSETIILYGFGLVVSLWAAIGATTKRWNPDILYIGTIAVDVISFCPIMKQYLLPHEPASAWCVVAWIMFSTGAFINFTFVERLFTKLRADHLTYGMMFEEKKSYGKIFKVSAFSLENFTLIFITVILMMR